MYQSYFGLTRPAFSASPHAGSCAGVPTMKNAFESLVRCLADGCGIGIVTAPAGLGKTILCQTVAEELAESFATVLLPNANFATRRSFLQAILCELRQPYTRMSEQELRLELMSAVRALRPRKSGLALLLDEAHLLSDELLEEARTLTNLFGDGDSLVRLLLAGQLPLEETLTSPSLEALNQRIGCHVTLEPLTRQESAEYIGFRLNRAGVDPAGIFSKEALSLICHASDGVPRCINQLCDHSLSLAFLAKERPVGPETVRTALDDLKQLPLHWNELPLARSSAPAEGEMTPATLTEGTTHESTDSFTPNDILDDAAATDNLPADVFECGPQTTECIEIGSDECAAVTRDGCEPHGEDRHQTGTDTVEITTTLEMDENTSEPETFEVGAETVDNPRPPTAVANDSPVLISTGEEAVSEEAVVDPYARLDAEFARPERQTTVPVGDAADSEPPPPIDQPAAIAETSPPEPDILTTTLETSPEAETPAETPAEPEVETGGYAVRYEYDVVHPEPDDAPSVGIETVRDDTSLDQPTGRGSTARRRQYDELVQELRRRYRKQA